MQNFSEELQLLLSNCSQFVENGKLLRNKIIESALNLDANLLELLLQNSKIKKHFFVQVNDVSVFDKIKFHQFVANKQFLPDSYTSFQNKIGLLNNNEYISNKNEVVLAWAYKDCILEGGQTKEDQKRTEIFWNETLAPNEIDRLLSPKTFTNFRRYSQNGISVVSDISEKENFIIKGNNLLVLHSLKEMKNIAQKVKLIYIDPPYNTENDSFQYNDSFNHSTWLTFMKNRLEIAWQLLSNDGSFFIQVDDNEFAYLKVLCDEVFGRDKFRETIILKSSTESGVNAINVKRGERLFKVKEYILFYSKSNNYRFKPFYTKADFNMNYKFEATKNEGKYIIRDIYKEFVHKQLENTQSKKLTERDKEMVKHDFVKYALSHSENIYSLEKNIKKAGEKFKAFSAQNKEKQIVEEYINSTGETVLVYDGGSLVPLKERVVNDNGTLSFGVLASDLWVDIGTAASNEGNVSWGNGKKPEKLLKRIIEMNTEEGDLVLDFHLGSGTTAAVAHKLGRRFIGIEQMDYGENDSVQRLLNVISGDVSGISSQVNWQGGGDFIFTELKELNQPLIARILAANNKKELHSIFRQMQQSDFVSFRIEMLKEEDFAELDFETFQKALINLVDFNNLYLPYSEIDDDTFSISDEEKRMNHQLYNPK